MTFVPLPGDMIVWSGVIRSPVWNVKEKCPAIEMIVGFVERDDPCLVLSAEPATEGEWKCKVLTPRGILGQVYSTGFKKATS